MKTTTILLSAFLFWGVALMSLFAEDSVSAPVEKPAPGKQVAATVELPASTSTWDYGKERMKRIGDPRPVDSSKNETVRYWIFLPTDYEKLAEAGGAPLLLFLHGAGERGDSMQELEKVKIHGPTKRLAREPEFAQKFPAVVVSPQCKNNYAWSPSQLMLLLDHIEKNFKIDKNRIYVSGISMGGFGTWMCLNESPTRFAAAAPVCGGALTDWAPKLIDIPIWNFHGDKDGAVPFSFSQNMVDALKKAGGKKVVFTIYEGAGHDVWTSTYENRLFYDWLFSHAQ